jgi:hypothetical protein
MERPLFLRALIAVLLVAAALGRAAAQLDHVRARPLELALRWP